MHYAMRQTCTASPGPSTERSPLFRARARPEAAARALLALIVAVSGLAVTSDAHAQDAVPQVTIEAVYPTTVAGSEDLVFDVTASSAPDEDLLVSVTLSPGILSGIERTYPVLILAGSMNTRLSLSTTIHLPDATTGDVTATLVDGDAHDVGDPSTATVRMFVGDAAVAATVGFSAPAYTLAESVGTTTDQIRLTVRTNPDTPVPRSLTVPVRTRDGTAASGDDYSSLSGTATFLPPWTTEETPDGNVYSAEVAVPVSVLDDNEVEGDERFTVWVGFPTESPDSVSLITTDSAPECGTDGCGSYVTITDNDHSGDVTIEAVHDTALSGIDNLVFTVTRSVVREADLQVPVTLSSGIIATGRLSHTVTIPANETSAELAVGTADLDPDAATGDVTATVGDGDGHDVGDPSSATVRVHVGRALVTVRLNEATYTLEESIGTTTDEISLIAMTEPGVPAPSTRLQVSVSTRAGTAGSPDDYEVLTEHFTFAANGWVAFDDSYRSQVRVPLTILDDGIVEGAETFRLLLERAPSTPSTVVPVSLNSPPEPCELDSCESEVTIVDDDVEPDPADQVVVTLVHVPDGTVIPDDSTVGVGGIVVDGTTFAEDEKVFFRLLFEAGDGGPAPGGADVELSFDWTHYSPIVPTSGQVSRIVLSLYRVDVWDSAVQILDNDVGNPDSTLRVRITGCERNGCIIGTPSEITVTITDDDGGPAAAPPGPPDPPRLVCASTGGGYDATAVAVSWSVPSFVGGAPISGYEVQHQRRISGGDQWVWGEWQSWPHTGTTTSTTIAGLDADALYAVQVRAVNTNGPGQWSLASSFWSGYSQNECEIIDQLTPSS